MTEKNKINVKFRICLSSIQFLSHVQLFVTPLTAACQASLPITKSQSSLKLMSIESVMPSKLIILRLPLLLLTSIFSSIMVFSKESVLHGVEVMAFVAVIFVF